MIIIPILPAWAFIEIVHPIKNHSLDLGYHQTDELKDEF